jgi:NAD(P)-dependent dehydrogenase (short-subunit alcohol dehydrogenase family)
MSDRILVLGGTRGTGQAVVEQLVAQNRSCVVIARNVNKARSLFGDTVEILPGDVTKPHTLEGIDDRLSAIIYTVDITGGIGGRGFFESKQAICDVTYGGVVNTINAAKAQGFTGQFVMLTTLGLQKTSLIMNLLAQIKSGTLQAARDKANYLIQSGIPYTIVQAGALHDGRISQLPLTIISEEVEMKLSYGLSRFHLAQIMIATIGNKCALNRVFSVYGGHEPILDAAKIQAQLNGLGKS